MEQQEEKKMEVYRRPRRKSSSLSQSNSSFPLDLVPEMLLNLPAKSILMSRCVSKLWSSITTNPDFVNSFETRSSTKPNLLIYFKEMDNLVVFSFPHRHQNSNGNSYSSYPSQHVDRYQIKCPKDLCFSSSESVRGLICLQNSATPIIWNPSLRQFLTLPKPEKTWWKVIRVFLGYHPMEGKHKVLCMVNDKYCNEFWVLTLGSAEESWRRIETNLYHVPFSGINGNGRCINGVLYYKARLHREHQVLMSFNVRFETFQPITLPIDYNMSGLLIVYKGRLAFVDSDYNGKGIRMWVLEDAEEELWLEKSFLAPLSLYDESLNTEFKLSDATDGGEFIYEPISFHKSLWILYFDPRKDSFRKLEFKGIRDEEFRLSNGLGKYLFMGFKVYVNHIDTLISL